DSFEDRIKLGDQANKNGDFAGEIVEYEAALKIKDDSEVREKLKKVIVPAEWKQIKDGVKKPSHPVSHPGDVDFGPYMAKLQRSIKKHWFPPKGDESRRAKVTFDVRSDGEISNVKLEKSTGSPTGDQAALKAVKDTSPADPLPKGSPKVVSIEFTFDYNVF